ncbi:Hypothetical protein SLIV_23292 [Streptomyces lividans TK24]|uniref:Uncharacterized protein n=1 Tax=Streptomyces lividans TK24 TaxID=457428 RepID=A0ABX6TPX1_STRLI|nr:Hypothetical protein SLIV_23292 [Streptomyces lividans TK24]QSJ11160.1 Hypothetical protein SLIVDG2_23292 [Streptomyces lividans]QTD72070.1 Hypothetical protein SLIVYQS_23292 [Streptomyces lividans TK24] [Streptomyces lividans]
MSCALAVDRVAADSAARDDRGRHRSAPAC